MTDQVTYGRHLFPGNIKYYIRTGDSSIDVNQTHNKIRDTLISSFTNNNSESLINQLAKRFNFNPETPVTISFMNYGNTQMVYLATIQNTMNVAVLINQPHTPKGVVKEEFRNLERLTEIDSRYTVEPYAFFETKEHEIYASQYIDNAFCIAHFDRGLNSHGAYNTLPHYHFEKFSPEMSHTVNTCIIALLVNYYDSERNKGLAKTQISGDDFILTRAFRMDNPSTVAPNIKIIAARGIVDMPFDKYLDMLRKEFVLGTNRTDEHIQSGETKVNYRSKNPMTSQQIEEGIKLGLELRSQRN